MKSVHAAQFGSAFAPGYVYTVHPFLKSREEYVSDSVQDCKWILRRLRKNLPNLAKINITVLYVTWKWKRVRKSGSVWKHRSEIF